MSSTKRLRLGISVFALTTSAMFGSVGLSSASALEPNDPTECKRYTSSTGNVVMRADGCYGKGYVPDVAGADVESQRIALEIWKGVVKFCLRVPDATALRAAGYSIDSDGNSQGDHWSKGITAATTTAEIIRQSSDPSMGIMGQNGRVMGIMMEAKPMGYVGSIPRVHDHDNNPGYEMLHVWCQTTIEPSYNLDDEPNVPSPEELKAALARAEAGGIAAVSSQLGGVAPATTTADPSKPTTTVAPHNHEHEHGAPSTTTTTAAVKVTTTTTAGSGEHSHEHGDHSTVTTTAGSEQTTTTTKASKTSSAPAHDHDHSTTSVGQAAHSDQHEHSTTGTQADITAMSAQSDVTELAFTGSDTSSYLALGFLLLGLGGLFSLLARPPEWEY